MILDTPDLWDAEALAAIIAHPGSMKQMSDNTEIGSPWLNLMSNSLNTQIISFRNPDFLEVFATHGWAQLALYDEGMWDKYQRAKLAGGVGGLWTPRVLKLQAHDLPDLRSS